MWNETARVEVVPILCRALPANVVRRLSAMARPAVYMGVCCKAKTDSVDPIISKVPWMRMGQVKGPRIALSKRRRGLRRREDEWQKAD